VPRNTTSEPVLDEGARLGFVWLAPVLLALMSACGGGPRSMAEPTARRTDHVTPDTASASDEAHVTGDGCLAPELTTRLLACPPARAPHGTSGSAVWRSASAVGASMPPHAGVVPSLTLAPPPGPGPAAEASAASHQRAGSFDVAARQLRELIAAHPESPRRCHWRERLAAAVLALGPGPAANAEVTALMRVVDELSVGATPDIRSHCRANAAATLLDTALRAHRDALGTDAQPGTQDRDAMRATATLLRWVLEHLPDLDTLALPPERTWPSSYGARFFVAELSYRSQDYVSCASDFEALLDADPSGESAQTASELSARCHLLVYQQQYGATERELASERQSEANHRGDEAPSLEPRELTPIEGSIVRSFIRHSCAPGSLEDRPRALFVCARVFYEARHHREAAALFREIAWAHRRSELAADAARLYLDSLRVIAAREPAEEVPCRAARERASEELRGMYCAEPVGDAEALCAGLRL
jgi:hypothetical protein